MHIIPFYIPVNLQLIQNSLSPCSKLHCLHERIDHGIVKMTLTFFAVMHFQYPGGDMFQSVCKGLWTCDGDAMHVAVKSLLQRCT